MFYSLKDKGVELVQQTQKKVKAASEDAKAKTRD